MTERSFPLLATVLLALGSAGACTETTAPPQALQVDVQLEALKTAALWPNPATQTIVVLANRYQASGRNRDAHTFFRDASAARPELAVLMAYEGLFAARMAGEITLTERVGWVRDAIATLNRARDLDNTLPRFLRAATLAQLPERFECALEAVAELDALLSDEESFIYTEVNESTRQTLTRIAWQSKAAAFTTLERTADAEDAWRRAGGKPIGGAPPMAAQLAVSEAHGFRFMAPTVYEPVAGIHVARGYDFGNITFVETTDGLVVIDAGTTPGTAASALEAVREKVGDVPIHTLLITHAHWDHIGGVESLLEPQTQLIAQERFFEGQEFINEAELDWGWFFGAELQPVRGVPMYDVDPEVLISEPTELTVGEHTFTLYPMAGGETEDQLLIALNTGAERVLFVGDAFMPYIGAPFIHEGNPEALLATMEFVVSQKPTLLLQGHPPLTELFSIEVLPALHAALVLANQAVMDGIFDGTPIAEIIRDTPLPVVLQDSPLAVVPYLVMGPRFMQRLHRGHTGYWQADHSGVEVIAPDAWASALDLLAGNSEPQWVSAIENLLDRGDHALAWRLSEYALRKYDSAQLAQCRKSALHGLRARWQWTDPFKFIHYSQLVETQTRVIAADEDRGVKR